MSGFSCLRLAVGAERPDGYLQTVFRGRTGKVLRYGQLGLRLPCGRYCRPEPPRYRATRLFPGAKGPSEYQGEYGTQILFLNKA